jgi:hypothetical protein
MNLRKPLQRGRPPTLALDRLRTRIWFHAVSIASGLNPSALERLLDPEKVRKDETGRVERPKKWDRYRLGKLVPEDVPGGAIERAEQRFAGSARWFRHPLWIGLRSDPVTAEDTMTALQQLDASVVNAIFSARVDAPSENWEPSYPRINTEPNVISHVAHLGSVDALAATLLLAKRAEAIASSELRDIAVNLYVLLQASFADNPEWGRFHPELFDFCDSRMKSWGFVNPAHRMDIFITWRGVRSEVWPEGTRQRSEEIELATGHPSYGLTEQNRFHFALPDVPPKNPE